MQNELGGKEGLFFQAFDVYLAEAEKKRCLPIATGNLHTIVEVYQKLFNDVINPMSCHGCFAMNTMSDENAVSEEIEKRRTRILNNMNTSFLSALQNEKKNNQLKENLDIKKAAIFLTTSIIGIMTLIKVKNNTSYSRSSWEVLVQQMMSWRKA